MREEHKCPLGGKCCQGEGETFWIEDFSKLFCSLSPVPYGNLNSGERLNAITRLVIYVTVLLVACKYKSAVLFLAAGLVFVVILYFLNKSKTAEQEKFQFLSQEIINNMNTPLTILNSQQFNNIPQAEKMRFQAQMKQLPIYSKNISNNYRGSSEKVLKTSRLDFEKGDRDSEAGIQYFKTKSGVNRKTMIEPIIAPRILDQDIWGQSRIVRDGINNQYMVDLTTSDPDYGQNISGMEEDPIGMGTPFRYADRVEGQVVPENNINDKPNIGRYGTREIFYGNENEKDFNKNVLPIYKNFYKKINNNIINTETDPMMNYDYFGQFKPTQDTPSEAVVIPRQKAETSEKQKSKEPFRFVNLDDQSNGSYGNYTPFDYNSTVQQQFGKMGQDQRLDNSYDIMERGVKKNTTPVSNIVPTQQQLLSESPTYIYNDEYFNQPSSRLYLQDIQPKLYSYAVDQTPVNANIGISYNPQRPPRFMDQIVDANKKNYPLMTRIDPQLVRDDGTPGQIAINPIRTDWSAKYSDYEAPAGSINFEDIYDPRFTSYGDPYRSYSDINLGQVRYYYSDVDAYKMPNFIQRSNVDFIEFTNPQGQVWPYYNRETGLDDIKSKVENQTTADEIYHREDMMENLMAKMNRSNYQQRYAPLRRSANGNSTFGPS